MSLGSESKSKCLISSPFFSRPNTSAPLHERTASFLPSAPTNTPLHYALKPEKPPHNMSIVRWVFILSLFTSFHTLSSLASTCELSYTSKDGTIYSYSLASPIPNHPHGVLSEDGFYRVAANETLLWFQICSSMLFNHDPPKCFGCQDCGGSSECGYRCSALVSNSVGGYPVCTTIGKASSQIISLVDKKYPAKGVSVKIAAIGSKTNCSLSISILCMKNSAQEPNYFDVLGTCNYATVLRHPSGCPLVISASKRWGWFSTLLIVLFCLLATYLLAGAAYRFFALRIRGPHIIPNLDFWVSLPQRGRNLLKSLSRKLSRQSSTERYGSYAPAHYQGDFVE